MITRRTFIKRGALFLPALGIAKASAQTLINPYRFAAAGGGYTPSNAVFDGTNDFMRINTVPTGLADGKQFTFSTWVRFDGGNGSLQLIWNFTGSGGGADNRFSIYKDASNNINAYGRDSGGTDVLSIKGGTAVTSATGWIHLYVCADMADTAKRKIYINGSAESLTVTTYADAAIDFTQTTYEVGAYGDNNFKLNGAASEFWFDDSYLDDTTKFASGGCPISLGSDGSTPTGSQPVIYFKGSGNGFNVNSGTGGDFTVTGSLGTTTGPC